jgi:hypothetical protein
MQPEVAEALRAIVQRDCLSQSMFVNNAVIRAIRNHRSPLEFINEGREKRDREAVPGVLDAKLDRPDGVPLPYSETNAAKDWKYCWDTLSEDYMRTEVNRMRDGLEREPLTEAEWQAIVRYMGSVPGSGKVSRGTSDFGENCDD